MNMKPFKFSSTTNSLILKEDLIKKAIERYYNKLDCFNYCSYVVARGLLSFLEDTRICKETTEPVGFRLMYDEDDKLVNRPDEFLIDKDTHCIVSISVFDDGEFYSKFLVFYNKEEDIEYLMKQDARDTLEPIAYQALMAHTGPVFMKIHLSEVTKPALDDNFGQTLQEDIKNFFTNEEFYKDSGFHYKRGALLYGEPGTGKTSALKHISSKLNVPMIFCEQDMRYNAELRRTLQELCPQGCVVVIEDIDGIDSYKRSELLNFLDGISSPSKCYFIATTNHLDRVDFALSNRPSRFDMVVEIGLPKPETREEIIKIYFKDFLDQFDMQEAVKLTEGFSGAYIKELYILFRLNNITFKQAAERLKLHLEVAKRRLADGDEDDYYG